MSTVGAATELIDEALAMIDKLMDGHQQKTVPFPALAATSCANDISFHAVTPAGCMSFTLIPVPR